MRTIKYIKIIGSLAVLIAIFSCNQKSELKKIFNCTTKNSSKTKTIHDFNKNFKLTIATNWNTKLYFDKYSSEIFAADTTKQLTESFILVSSYNTGKLNFDVGFNKKIDSISKAANLKIIKSGNTSYNHKKSYWYLTEGVKNNYVYHQFNLTTILSDNTFFNGYADIYGEDNWNDRICEAISIFENVEFLE